MSAVAPAGTPDNSKLQALKPSASVKILDSEPLGRRHEGGGSSKIGSPFEYRYLKRGLLQLAGFPRAFWGGLPFGTSIQFTLSQCGSHCRLRDIDHRSKAGREQHVLNNLVGTFFASTVFAAPGFFLWCLPCLLPRRSMGSFW